MNTINQSDAVQVFRGTEYLTTPSVNPQENQSFVATWPLPLLHSISRQMIDTPLGLHRWVVSDDATYAPMVQDFWAAYGHYFILISIFYLPLVPVLRFLWRPMPALNLRTWRLLHNLAFCIFSALGTIELTPVMWNTLFLAENFKETVCGGYFQSRPETVWIIVFVASKALELLETFYFVLEKRSIPFIHWYHHEMTFVFCASCLYFLDRGVIYYAWMNFAVHAFMYFYYCVATITKSKPGWAIIVTISQILQMFVGTAVTFQTFFCEGVKYVSSFSFSLIVGY